MRNEKNNSASLPLLDYRFRYLGILLIITGATSGYLYFFGGKPDWLVTKIFAVLTSYLETRTFVIAQTNLFDEIAAVFMVTGFIGNHKWGMVGLKLYFEDGTDQTFGIISSESN